MKENISGPAMVLGDNIDTDQIYPGRFLALTDPKEIGSHCLAGLDEKIASAFPAGGILIAGKNFGCGSSREHAPIALLNMGVAAILADSFARIFYRNAMNLGLPLVVCEGLSRKVKNDDTVSINVEKGYVTVEGMQSVYKCEKINGQALKILEAGGIKPLMRERFKNYEGGEKSV